MYPAPLPHHSSSPPQRAITCTSTFLPWEYWTCVEHQWKHVEDLTSTIYYFVSVSPFHSTMETPMQYMVQCQKWPCCASYVRITIETSTIPLFPPETPRHFNFWNLACSNSHPMGPKICSNTSYALTYNVDYNIDYSQTSIYDHLSEATTYPKHHIFPSQRRIIVIFRKWPPLISDRDHLMFGLTAL